MTFQPMNYFKITLGSLVLLSVFMSACSKTDDDAQKNRMQAAITGTWKKINSRYDANLDSSFAYDNWTILDSCYKDNITTLASNGNYSLTEGGISCWGNDSDFGTWRLSADGSRLGVQGANTGQVIYKIRRITATRLELINPSSILDIYQKQ